MKNLEKRIRVLETELRRLKLLQAEGLKSAETVIVPDELAPKFADVERQIKTYFSDLHFDPVSGEITVFGQRYVLLRSDSISNEFVDFVKEKYADIPEENALSIAHNF